MKNKKIIKEDEKLVDDLLASLRSRAPILKNPDELTDDIMDAIRLHPEQEKPGTMTKPGEMRSLVIIRRLLAAASVCLFLVFGYEEYIVVNKISKLEKQSSATSKSSRYQATPTMNMVMTASILDPQLINKYIGLTAKNPDIQSIFKAALIVRAWELSPDALNMLSISGLRSSDQAFKTIFHKFDSTHHTR